MIAEIFGEIIDCEPEGICQLRRKLLERSLIAKLEKFIDCNDFWRDYQLRRKNCQSQKNI